MRKPRRKIPMNTSERAHKHAKKYDRNDHRSKGKRVDVRPEDVAYDYDPDYPCDGCVTHCRGCMVQND